jgi:hypothetical protein
MVASEQHIQLGCLYDWHPSLDRHRQQIEARFVFEEQGSSFIFGFFKCWPALLLPLRDHRLIPLTGPLTRLLRTPAERMQQLAHMVWMIVHTTHACDDDGHTPGCPAIPSKAERLTSLFEQYRKLLSLFLRQSRCRSRRWMTR